MAEPDPELPVWRLVYGTGPAVLVELRMEAALGHYRASVLFLGGHD